MKRGHNFCQFSENPSDLAVDYLISNPHLIDWKFFVGNINPGAVDYCIEKWDELPEKYKDHFSYNLSQKAIDWLHLNQKFIDLDNIKQNPFNYTFNRLKYVKSKRRLVKG
jgi:hypothetical protein